MTPGFNKQSAIFCTKFAIPTPDSMTILINRAPVLTLWAAVVAAHHYASLYLALRQPADNDVRRTPGLGRFKRSGPELYKCFIQAAIEADATDVCGRWLVRPAAHHADGSQFVVVHA